MTDEEIQQTREAIAKAVEVVRDDEVWEPAHAEAMTFLLTAYLLQNAGRPPIAFFSGLPKGRVDALASTARRARIFAGGKLQSDYAGDLGLTALAFDALVLQGKVTRSRLADGDIHYALTETEKRRIEAEMKAPAEVAVK